MKAPNLESRELMLLTGIQFAVTIVAILMDHSRTEFMIVMTLLMAVMAFLASLRHRKRRVRTLPGRGQRKARASHL